MDTTNTLPVAIYIRSEEGTQRRAHQYATLKTLAERLGVESEVYYDGDSTLPATERPQLQALLEAAREGHLQAVAAATPKALAESEEERRWIAESLSNVWVLVGSWVLDMHDPQHREKFIAGQED